jgi:hypothetical protein
MRRGLGVPLELPASLGACTLMHVSKNILALTMLSFDGAFLNIRDAWGGTTTCNVICGEGTTKLGVSPSSSSCATVDEVKEGVCEEGKCNGF